MKVSERLKVVDVIGTKVYKDGEQIIAQVQFISTFSSSIPIANNLTFYLETIHTLNEVFLFQPKQNKKNLQSKRGDYLALEANFSLLVP